MSTVTKCTCGHEISQHTYSEDFIGCDVLGCNCMLNLGGLIDMYQIEITDRTAQNLKDMEIIDELRTTNARLITAAAGRGMVSEMDNMQEVAVLVCGLHDKIARLENFIRTRNVVCTWCGFMVVYDSQDEQAKQSAYAQVNTHALICKKDPRNIDLKAVEANYDALQSPMACGHLARYAVNEEAGTQYCAICNGDALFNAGEKALEYINKMNEFARACIRYAGNSGDDYLADKAREALGENDYE